MYALFTAWMQLIRWKNLSMLIILALIYRHLIAGVLYRTAGIPQPLSEWPFYLLLISLILTGAGGYLINSIMDVRIDWYNKPDKMVLGKIMDLHLVRNVYYGLSICGLATGFVAAWMSGHVKLGALPLIAAGLFYSYSFRYKRVLVLGNLLVAFLSGLFIPVFWIFDFFSLRDRAVDFAAMVPLFGLFYKLLALLFFFAFSLNLVREIFKDIEDQEGDRKYGCKSIPIQFGNRASLLIINLILLIISTTAWIFLPRTQGSFHLLNNLFILLFFVAPLLLAGFLPHFLSIRNTVLISTRLVKFCMLTGIVSLVFSLIPV